MRFGTSTSTRSDSALPWAIEARQADAVGGLRRRVDDRRLQHAVVGLDGVHRVLGAGAADHEELVASGGLDGRQHADTLVVVVVPDGVDLRGRRQQLRGRCLAALHGEVRGDAVADLEAAVTERVGEAARAVLRERQRVDAGDLGDDGVGVVAELLADVGAGADAHAVVVTEDGGARGEGARELAVDVDDRDAGLHRLDRDLGERGAVGRQQHDGVDAVVDEGLDLADLQVGVVRALRDDQLDVRVLRRLGDGRRVDRAEPAVVGGGAREADGDGVAGLVVVRVVGGAGVTAATARRAAGDQTGDRQCAGGDEQTLANCEHVLPPWWGSRDRVFPGCVNVPQCVDVDAVRTAAQERAARSSVRADFGHGIRSSSQTGNFFSLVVISGRMLSSPYGQRRFCGVISACTGHQEPLLTMRGITKSFAGVPALRGVDLEVLPRRSALRARPERRGQVHADQDPRPAPTSPTAARSSGRASPSPSRRPTAALELGIATMYQELDVVDGLTIAENIFLGHELSTGGVLHTGAANRLDPRAARPARPRRPRPVRARSDRSSPRTSRSSAWRARCRATQAHHHGRAERRARLRRGQEPVPRRRGADLAGHRGHLHLPPARGDPPDRRPHHGHQGRQQHGERPPRRRHPDRPS